MNNNIIINKEQGVYRQWVSLNNEGSMEGEGNSVRGGEGSSGREDIGE